ncbi:MAG: hypothetical protein HY433_01270 [Candidatus Liptonbacteria bacterium]|nr:hypothetical protein [Candidatus Liptonbacteria bacterium]
MKTKIICTIGPKSDSAKTLSGLIRKKTDALRINLSHTPPERAIKLIEDIRALSKKIPIIIDTQGKETRMMAPFGKTAILKRREHISIIPFGSSMQSKSLWITRPEFIAAIPRGEKISIDDNRIVLKVLGRKKDPSPRLECVIVRGGEMSVPKNIRLEKKIEPKTMLTDADRLVIKKALPYGISEISLSYVSAAKDVEEVRRFIGKKNILISSKIETRRAINNLDSLIAASDTILIDRNDLGTEIGYEKIPFVQKLITKQCVKERKPIFVATHLLENMLHKDKPTRGEVNDIINLVLDGVNGLILSSETAVGKNPVKILGTLRKIVSEAEVVLAIQQKNNSTGVIERLNELNYI